MASLSDVRIRRSSPSRGGRPGRTPGITATWQARGARIMAAAAAPGAAITVMPRVGPTSPRARATVPLTYMDGGGYARRV